MSTHNHEGNAPDDHEVDSPLGEKPDSSAGYERSDVRAKGIVHFLTVLSIFAVLSGVFCYEFGKVLFAHIEKQDGPKSKWAKTVDVRPLGNMANSPDLEKKMATVTQQFPTPRLQTDDGSQEIADLHAKEDLLLENYSWVDQSQGKVRIPIERAMELIAQRGLPQAPTVEAAPLLTGDVKPVVAVPLTNGFARTGYEQDVAQAEKIAGKRGERK